MKPIRIERVVAAPAERVWGILTDLQRTAGAISAIDRLERLDSGSGFGVGTRWRETRTIFGKEATEEMAITAVEPGRSYVVEAESRGTHYRSEMGVAPEGAEGSRLWMTFAGEARGVIGRLLGATLGWMFRGSTRRMLERDLADIAAAAEGERLAEEPRS